MAEVNRSLPGDRLVAYATLSPSVALLFLLVAVPTITVFVTSFQSVGLGETSGPFVGLANYQRVLSDPLFLVALRNTLVWVFGSVSLEMVLGVALALLLNTKFRFRGLARAIVLAPYLLPTVVAVLIWHYMFNDLLGVLNHILMSVGIIQSPLLWLNSPGTAMISVILVGTWKFTPFVVIALLGILQSLPEEQYEAAKIDGANAIQRFWRLTLPHILPVFLLTALLRTIWTFQKFDIIYLLTGGGPLDSTTTLPVLVYEKGFVDFQLGRAAALALITFAILSLFLGVYLYLMKRAEAHQ